METAYSQLLAHIEAGQSKMERAWGNNTRVRRIIGVDPHIAAVLHNTDIAACYPDGRVTLNTGGWRTATTQDRINKVLRLAVAGNHWRVWSEKGQWRLYFYSAPGAPIPSYSFADGCTVYPDGRVEGVNQDAADRQAQLTKDAKAYVKHLVDALLAGSLPAPGSGDCWYCCMVNEDGQTWGDTTQNDHIQSHIAEGYLVPSLLANVIVDPKSPLGPLPRQLAFELLQHTRTPDDAPLLAVVGKQLRRATWVYIASRLGLAR